MATDAAWNSLRYRESGVTNHVARAFFTKSVTAAKIICRRVLDKGVDSRLQSAAASNDFLSTARTRAVSNPNAEEPSAQSA